jgi:hypothetical protein
MEQRDSNEPVYIPEVVEPSAIVLDDGVRTRSHCQIGYEREQGDGDPVKIRPLGGAWIPRYAKYAVARLRSRTPKINQNVCTLLLARRYLFQPCSMIVRVAVW